jgi:hypothetical protein
MTLLADWENFYVILGSSGAALTGLQFVVITLLPETRQRGGTAEIDAFATPTIVHFGAVLLLSAILSVPWSSVASAGLALGACGVGGVTYAALVVRRATRQTGYRLVLEDWLWYVVLPCVAYSVVLLAALTIVRHTASALFVIGAMVLLLLFIGIHNSWDSVTYVAIDQRREPAGGTDRP